jgi:hypothetical protein
VQAFLIFSTILFEHLLQTTCNKSLITSFHIHPFVWHLIVSSECSRNLGIPFCFSIRYGGRSQDSIVSIATGYRLNDRGVGVRVPVGSRIFTSPCRPDQLWGLPSLLYSGYGGLFPRGKAAGA